MAKADLISAERLRELFDYDPDTGIFKRRSGHGRKNSKSGMVGHLASNGYIQMYVDGVNTRAHRLAWLYVYGVHPSGAIDHINGDRSDNRIDNLREATSVINSQNMTLKPERNKHFATGVYECKGKFRAEIMANNTRYQLGIYDSPTEAAAAYNAGKILLHKCYRSR